MKRFIVTCMVMVIFAGCATKDARTLTTIFSGIEAISSLSQVHQQDRIATALEKQQEQQQKDSINR